MRPDVFAAVMATGIVSIAAAEHGYTLVSTVLAVLAVTALPVLAAAGVATWRRAPLDLTDPDVTLRLFTFVAACAVLDARLAEIPGALWTLAVLAVVVWMTLVVLTRRALAARCWPELQARARGAWELPSVGTSGLAIVLTELSQFTGWRPLLGVAAVVWGLAIAAYCVMTSLILRRAFLARLDPNGFEPDAWILMGGLAIATLAGDRIHRLSDGWLAEVTRSGAAATWVVATLWLPPLLYFAVRHLGRPRVLRFAGVWWSMVFPLGMYSMASYVVVVETGWAALTTVSLVFCWIAMLSWLLVAAGGLARSAAYLAGRRTAQPGNRVSPRR
ncbi:tellurite resistance/C4-dicarboxylate transporter family protein [Mycolicibacterium austroafricanum]|uniref:tellurite resistance/C4-dicarboxylate transporter family protein n=1 Tax=Mycolicibacterium austroafricanum TaxID=39687 RepID=UPI001F32C84D|nr:tellurite resistance/C4-dicarboxylate transporter family protein [Mycolicibacterium austroafricanum]